MPDPLDGRRGFPRANSRCTTPNRAYTYTPWHLSTLGTKIPSVLALHGTDLAHQLPGQLGTVQDDLAALIALMGSDLAHDQLSPPKRYCQSTPEVSLDRTLIML